MICYTEPGLTEALYILYVKCKYIVFSDNTLITADNDSDKRQTRPLVREGAPQEQDSNSQT
jgi:hypothetical protein